MPRPCRWNEGGRCVLKRREVEAECVRCGLWDPPEGEKLPPELPMWRRRSPLADATIDADLEGEHNLSKLRYQVSAAMRRAGIPLAVDEMRGQLAASCPAVQAWRREHLEEGEA